MPQYSLQGQLVRADLASQQINLHHEILSALREPQVMRKAGQLLHPT